MQGVLSLSKGCTILSSSLCVHNVDLLDWRVSEIGCYTVEGISDRWHLALDSLTCVEC